MALMLVLGVVIASVSTAGAASLITGKQIKDGTIATKDLSKAVRKQLATTGSAGVTGPQGAQGAPGPAGDNGAPGARGTNGANGTDGTINGVAAGGDLTGTFPNPGSSPARWGRPRSTPPPSLPTRPSSADGTQAPTSPEAARSRTPPATIRATRSRSAPSGSATLAPPLTACGNCTAATSMAAPLSRWNTRCCPCPMKSFRSLYKLIDVAVAATAAAGHAHPRSDTRTVAITHHRATPKSYPSTRTPAAGTLAAARRRPRLERRLRRPLAAPCAAITCARARAH